MIGMTNVIRVSSPTPPTPTEFLGLKFTAQQQNSTVGYSINSSTGTLAPTLYYSFDGNSWLTFSTGTTITLSNIGDYVYIKGNNPNGLSKSAREYLYFVMSGRISASGNINSLLDNYDGSSITEIPNNHCFVYLFSDCTSLTTIPNLPATILKNNCYADMFLNCSSLTDLSNVVLPATTLAEYCYDFMFEGCTGITKAPSLPATTLTEGCYEGMFYGCSSLVQCPDLPARVLEYSCYAEMFEECTSLVNAPDMYFDTVPSDYWILGMMFYDCVNLRYIKLVNYTGEIKDDTGFQMWVDGVGSGGTIYYKGSTTTQGASAIPTGWTIVNNW